MAHQLPQATVRPRGGSPNRPRRPATPNSTPPQKGGSTDETTRPTERLAQSLGAESVPPSAPFDQEAIEAEHAEIHGRAQKYLLDHGLPKARYLEAIAGVEAGRDRAEPAGALSPKPPAQAARPAQDDWQRFDQEAKKLMPENETDYITALNTVMGEG